MAPAGFATPLPILGIEEVDEQMAHEEQRVPVYGPNLTNLGCS